RAGLDALSTTLADHGLGLILDIVPNHMAFAAETPWLRDVLRHGRDSVYAGHFDIDWSGGRLRLPWLGAPFADLAERGEIRIEGDEMVAPGLRLPLAASPVGDIVAIHDAQPWRLTHWRTEAAAIRHRRFFTVTGLIGLRVEDRAVFEDVHRLTFDLIDSGVAHGLRVDHVDGLADPAEYLDRLRRRLPDTPIWIEKILTRDEALPDWPVQGTTGYVAARAIAQVLTDADGAAVLAAGWPDFDTLRDDAKTQIVTTELQAELERLAELALAAGTAVELEWGRAAWRDALIAYVRAFPRYRTYTTRAEIPAADETLIRETATRAAAPLPHPGALPDLADLLTDPAAHPELRLRLQQLTGAAIAKAQEDTAFYRWTPLLSANEVGAEPPEPSLSPAEFHAAMVQRHARMPHGLTLTSSHDTKRSEDARMRLAAISHDPDRRDALLARVFDLPMPWRWYLAQSAFAAAPDGDLDERLAVHMEKALREAKEDTFWTAPNAAFEAPILAAARQTANAFDSVSADLVGLVARAENLALAQCALKLFAPGIPDIYQGTEIGSFRLTDPDNRAPVDWDALADLLAGGQGLTPFDRRKFDLTRTLLQLRRDRPDDIAAPWRPLEARPGRLSAARGTIRLDVTIDGTSFASAGSAHWPSDATVDTPVRISLSA
ncbi:MAG: malto-oligosyltrehalose synthase, partial [Pseudomonadota bacterium]